MVLDFPNFEDFGIIDSISNNYSKTSTNEINNSINCLNVDTKKAELINTITNQILVIYPWFMIICGTICNLLTFSVITRTKLKKSSTFVYLACLSIVDLSILYTFCINFIFFYQFKIDLQLTSIILCKVYSFLIYFLPQLSAWTVTAVSFDRVIGVIFSVRGKYAAAARRWNTPKKAYHVFVLIFLVLFLLNVQFFFYPNEFSGNPVNETFADVNIIYCSPESIPRFEQFYNIWVYIDLSVNVLIPFAFMIICSIIIVIGLIQTTKNLSATTSLNHNIKIALPKLETNEVHNESTNKVRFKSIDATHHVIDVSEALINHSKKKRASTASTAGISAKARSVSSMLATNNLVFISLTLPIVVFLSLTPPYSQMCDDAKAKTRFIKVIFIVLMHTNCTINIFIYSLMASEFRRQLFLFFTEFFFIKMLKKSSSEKSRRKSLKSNVNNPENL